MNRPGDILIAMYGATIGKLAILAESALTNQAVCGCRLFLGVLSDFLFFFLLSQRSIFRKSSKGGAQPNISRTKIITTPFPLPPIAEQQRIVNKVDELLSLCDQLDEMQTMREDSRDRLTKATLARLSTSDSNVEEFRSHVRFAIDTLPVLTTRVDQIKELRQAIINLAVRGKLVEQDPTDEPASELLKRILIKKKYLSKIGRNRKKKPVRPQMVSAPFELPPSWCWVALGTIFQYDAGMKRDPKTLEPSAWLLELKDIEKGTGQLINRVQIEDREPKSTKSQFSPGDILYGKLRPYLNKVLVANEMGYSTTEIVAIRPYLQLSSEYCALALRCPDFVEYVTRLGQGTKMPRLRTKDAIVAPFPLPPLAEQYRIVAKFNELMSLCQRLEVGISDADNTRTRLLDALFHVATKR